MGKLTCRVAQFEDCEVGALVLQHHIAVELAPVRKRHPHLIGIGDDVIVGHDDPRRIDDDTGTERALDALFRLPDLTAVTEETTEEWIGKERRRRLLDDTGGVHVDHGRRHTLDDRGEGKLDLVGRIRDEPPLARARLAGRRRSEANAERRDERTPDRHRHC